MEARGVTAIAPEIWTRLAGGRPHGETLWARRALPDSSDRLLAALDAEGRRHFLIRLESDEPDVHDEQSRGLGAVTRDLAMRGHDAGRYIDVTCHDVAGHGAFQVFGGELAERLASTTEPPGAAVMHVLAKWRRFWSALPRPILSRDEQIGLFAEVWFLHFWLQARIGPVAVARWRGPLGARHDFEWVGRSVEVKGTTSTRGTVHRINGLDQLAPPEDGELLFFSLRMREEGGATNTLPSLVAACKAALSSDDDALSQFESHLARVGYLEAHEPEYDALRLRVAAEELFAVRDDFPRLVPDSFVVGCPGGVMRIEYEIGLDGFERLRIANNPDDQILQALF